MNNPKLHMYNGNNVVSARELHAFLEIATDFTEWCKRMFEYGFEEKRDYVILLKNGENKISKSNPINYALTLECAKEISMIQRTEKGKIARQYFLDCEKQLKERENVSSTLPKTKEELWAMALTSLNEEVDKQKRQLELANQTIQLNAPKVEYVNEVLQSQSTHNTNSIAKELGMSAITLNRLLKDRGIQYHQGGRWLLYQKFQDKGYTKTKTHTFVDGEGKSRTEVLTVWTEAGRAFIHSLFNRNLGEKLTLNPLSLG